MIALNTITTLNLADNRLSDGDELKVSTFYFMIQTTPHAFECLLQIHIV